MKTLVIPSNINISKYIEIGAEAFIFGLDKYSVHVPLKLNIEEISIIVRDNPNIDIFISINKNIFNSELEDLKEQLKLLDNINIKGILFYDLGILRLKKELNLKTDLVWNQTHMVTNYNTCNYYYSKGVKYGMLAKEITLEEMLEITTNSKMSFMALIMGYPVMSHSRRKLLSNYYLSMNKTLDNNKKVIEDIDNNKYFIEEDINGTTIIDGNILNGIEFINKLSPKLEYSILNSMDIDDDTFMKVLELFNKLKDNYSGDIINKINSLIGNNTGFFMKKTIFKVK